MLVGPRFLSGCRYAGGGLSSVRGLRVESDLDPDPSDPFFFTRLAVRFSNIFLSPSHGYFVLVVSPTLANLGNDHGFISKGIHLCWYENFWGSPKQSHESLCSKWTISYHCRDTLFLTWY